MDFHHLVHLDNALLSTIIVAKHAFQGNASLHQISFPGGAHLLMSAENTSGAIGWSHGKYKKQKGWFPASYVEPVLPDQTQQVVMPEMHGADTKSDLIPTAPMPLSSPPPVPSKSGLRIRGPDEADLLTVKSSDGMTIPKSRPLNASKRRQSQKSVSSQNDENIPIRVSTMPDNQLWVENADDVSVVPHEFEVMGGNAADSTLWTPAPSIVASTTDHTVNIRT